MASLQQDAISRAESFLSVDCGAIARNLDALRGRTKSLLMAVVKHDGYGLTLTEYARLLVELGVEELAAGSCEEALALRRGGIAAPVLLLTPQVSDEAAAELLRRGVMLTVGSAGQAETVRRAAEATGIRPRVHIKIDTGLGRYGFSPAELADVPRAVGGMEVRGTYTHFSSPYADRGTTYRQYKAFAHAYERLKALGVDVGALHCCASGGFLHYPEIHMDAVRIGSALIGRVPGAQAFGLEPAASLVAPIAAVKSPAGFRIGYRGSVRPKKGARVAVLSVGYSFALLQSRRALGLVRERQFAVVNGRRAPVLGELGLGALAVDVSGIDCREGDIARLDANPLHCAGYVKRVFDYGGLEFAGRGPDEPLPGELSYLNPGTGAGAALACTGEPVRQ